MGIWDTITDLVEAAKPWSTAEAEAPVATEEEQVNAAFFSCFSSLIPSKLLRLVLSESYSIQSPKILPTPLDIN